MERGQRGIRRSIKFDASGDPRQGDAWCMTSRVASRRDSGITASERLQEDLHVISCECSRPRCLKLSISSFEALDQSVQRPTFEICGRAKRTRGLGWLKGMD